MIRMALKTFKKNFFSDRKNQFDIFDFSSNFEG